MGRQRPASPLGRNGQIFGLKTGPSLFMSIELTPLRSQKQARNARRRQEVKRRNFCNLAFIALTAKCNGMRDLPLLPGPQAGSYIQVVLVLKCVLEAVDREAFSGITPASATRCTTDVSPVITHLVRALTIAVVLQKAS